MRIDIGSSVNSADSHDIGTVDRLIVDPLTREVTKAVIRKGMFLPRDIEVPISSLLQSMNGELRLDLSAEDVKHLPEFQEDVYVMPPSEYQLPDGYTAGSLYWPAGIMTGPPRNIPSTTSIPGSSIDTAIQDEARDSQDWQAFETALIGKGSMVAGHDGQSVGKVEELSFDAKTGELAGLVVRSGLLLHSNREIDSSLIDSVEEGLIILKVDADQLPT